MRIESKGRPTVLTTVGLIPGRPHVRFNRYSPTEILPIIPGATITAITATGDRPMAFALCQRWMKMQTRQPDQWLVVDDGQIPVESFTPMEYIRREPQPNDPKPTLILNLRTILPLVRGGKILFMEDDEYYSPDYIEEMSRRLDQYELVGIMRSKYYHLISGGYFTHANIRHASLAATTFRSSFLPKVAEILNKDNNPFLDMRMWPRAGNRGYLFTDTEKSLYAGIKGLPGRAGICVGHNSTFYHTVDTPDRAMLKKWAPHGWSVYMDYLNGTLTEANYKEYFKWA